MEHNNFQTCKRLINTIFPYLEELNYKFSANVVKYESFSESLDCIYVNELLHRKITVSYSVVSIENRVSHIFDIVIIKLPYNDPTEDFLSLNIYANSMDYKLISTFRGSFDEVKAKDILNEESAMLKKYLMNVVEGKDWYKGFYPKW